MKVSGYRHLFLQTSMSHDASEMILICWYGAL